MAITTDLFFHGNTKKAAFFEGWYFKHQIGDEVYAFIPGLSIESDGRKQPFIQVISHEGSHYFPFSEAEFSAAEDQLLIKIGENYFSEQGISLSLESTELSVKGTLTYGAFHPISRSRYAPSIMGPFSYLSFMECYHGILSMAHSLSGTLLWNEQSLDFSEGIGYLEKDWGTSFPAAYLWAQCNQFEAPDVRFFFSAADIPFLGTAFLGIISVLQIGDKEYRLATYYGARLDSVTRKQGQLVIIVRQKGLELTIEVAEKEGHSLMAPTDGVMNRIIRESASTEILLTLIENGQTIFRQTGFSAGFEESGIVRGYTY